MNALIKKDFRNNLTPIVASLLAIVAPYAMAICMWMATPHSARGPLSNSMTGSAAASLWLTAILAATYGGIAFAHERRERSADFLAMMPTTRIRIALSKTCVACVCLGMMFLINALVFWGSWDGNRYSLQNVFMAATGALMTFGVAWMFSSFLESAAIAAGFGVAAIAGSMVFIEMIFSKIAGPDPHEVALTMTCCFVATVCGLLAFIIGNIIFLSRIAP